MESWREIGLGSLLCETTSLWLWCPPKTLQAPPAFEAATIAARKPICILARNKSAKPISKQSRFVNDPPVPLGDHKSQHARTAPEPVNPILYSAIAIHQAEERQSEQNELDWDAGHEWIVRRGASAL